MICKPECDRALHKRCDKVFKEMDAARKQGVKSNSRHLGPAETDKMQQFITAAHNDSLICPESDTGYVDKLPPFCCHVLVKTLMAQKTICNPQADDDIPRSPQRSEGPRELVGDDMLEILRRDEDPEELAPSAPVKPKKLQKDKVSKKGQKISLGGYTPPIDEDDPAHGTSPCSGSVTPPRSQLQAKGRQDESTPARTPPAVQVLPPPSQPPPPMLPPGWRPLWSIEHDIYYYWHPDTKVTTWDLPESEAAKAAAAAAEQAAAAAEQAAAAAAQAAERERRTVMVTKVCEVMGLDRCRAQSLLEECSWNDEQAIRVHNQRQREAVAREAVRAEAAARVEATKRSEAAAAAAAAAIAEAARMEKEADAAKAKAKQLMEEAARIAKADRERAWHLQAQVPLPVTGQPKVPGCFVCIRTWKPANQVSQTQCPPLDHGMRLYILSIDDMGWALGYNVEDTKKTMAYFDKAVLRAVPDEPSEFQQNSQCRVIETYQSPMSGYLSVQAGEMLRVLHPMESPFVWVYAQSLAAAGWVPASILVEV